MYVVVYKFEIIKKKENLFIESWKKLTELIYKHEGSLGSRLHKEKEDTYIAYAQWPNKKIWTTSGNKLPESAKTIRMQMRASCSKVEILYEMECVEDLLK